jgi:hypothetical protein
MLKYCNFSSKGGGCLAGPFLIFQKFDNQGKKKPFFSIFRNFDSQE